MHRQRSVGDGKRSERPDRCCGRPRIGSQVRECTALRQLKGDTGGAKSTKLSFLGENGIGADFDTLTSLVTVQ